MKIVKSIKKFTLFIILISLTFSFSGCNEEDEPIVYETFLEKYDNTTWSDTDEFAYLKFKNNKEEPVIIAVYNDEENNDCFRKGFTPNSKISVIKNSLDNLIIEITEFEPSYVFRISFTSYDMNGEIISIKTMDDEFEDDDSEDLFKSTVNIDDLKSCDD